MKTYTVTFRSATRWAEQTIRARTPQAALTKARRAFAADPFALDWQSYDSDVKSLDEIEINGEAEGDTALWQSDSFRRELAASDLLEALEQAVQALNTAPRFRVPHLDTDSYAIASLCDRAVAKAKGGVA